MTRKILKIGFDFDGVIAYNPFRIVRPLVAYFKRDVLGVRKLNFWYPKARWQQIFWTILHESSVFPARGVDLFKKSVDRGEIEAHLVTARYSFLDDHLYNWLNRYKLKSFFSTINLNKQDEQPHEFKDRLIKKYKFDFFIEDNLDIVKYLSVKQKESDKKCKIFWIYNILDHFVEYPYKYPYLEKALEEIVK